MTDVLTKEQRHKNMKNIRGKDTRIEVILRKPYGIKVIGIGKITKNYLEVQILR